VRHDAPVVVTALDTEPKTNSHKIRFALSGADESPGEPFSRSGVDARVCDRRREAAPYEL
jgi:hypothetical protein